VINAPLNGRMAWFGRHWGSPDLAHAQEVPTPVGEVCNMCNTAIVDGDNGYGLPGIVTIDDTPRLRAHWLHRECHLDDILTHTFGCCRCVYPDLTPRERGQMAIDRIRGA
jgi:hypothetical protein